MILSIGSALRPCKGESACGDAIFVGQGTSPTLVVVDGLGHGEQAAEAARRVVEFAAAHPDLEPRPLLEQASAAIAGSRGAAALAARFDLVAATLLVAGVGNVELRALASVSINPICTAGILGRPIRSIRQFAYPIRPGDLIMIASDGVSRRLELAPLASLSPQAIAAAILDKYGQSHDDATVVAIRVERACDAQGS